MDFCIEPHASHMYDMGAHVAEVVVEIYVGCTQVAAEQGGMRGEDGGHRQLPLST